jgi:hypothetical protein
VRVDAIGLAPVAAAEHARPCGKGGWHVNHGLPGGDQLLGEQVAEAAGALDRQVRSGQVPAQLWSLVRVALLADTRSSPSTWPASSSATAVCEDLCGSIPIVIT